MSKTQDEGLLPHTYVRTTYDTTGDVIAFEAADRSRLWSDGVAIKCYTGNALIALNGSNTGPFIELEAGDSLGLPVHTDAIYIKAKAATSDVGVVMIAEE